MQGAVIRLAGDNEFAGAIAEGMVKAENAALRETIDMLMCEIAQKDEIIQMYRAREIRARERSLERLRESNKKTRTPAGLRIAKVIGLI